MRRRGFANPEYLLSLAFLALVLAAGVPAIARARRRSRSLAALAQVRAAVAAYAADTKTAGPPSLGALAGKYLSALPEVEVPGRHPASAAVKELGVVDDSGGWSYSNWPGAADFGRVRVNCTHADAGGKAWSEY